MISTRTSQRLIRHHLPLALLCALGLAVVYTAASTKSSLFRWSMATAYVGLALLGLTLATGPWNLVRGRPNPVSTDLRRDIGIWAALVSIAHFIIGWQRHMKYRYLYFFYDLAETRRLVPRTDGFGFANYTGLVAVLVAIVLLAISNDLSLRSLGTPRWKWLQRWNYVLFAFTIVHGITFQVMAKRRLMFVVVLATMTAATVGAQITGVIAHRARMNQRRLSVEQP